MTRRQWLSLATASIAPAQKRADYTLRIGETNVEVAPKHTFRTVAYNGQAPGPLLRMTEGRQIVVDVVNETAEPEMVHWHGFHIPPEVDGAHEEGTPMVQGSSSRRYAFTPNPSGTRWYHTHAMAGHNLKRGLYSGQFGMVIVEPRSDPGRYDAEVPIVLHEWEGFFSADMDMDVDYRVFTINGRMFGAGEPVRVKRSQRILFRVVNASATMQHRLALPGHVFQVVALDGNSVASPASVPVLDLAPGERVDALVEMTNPGAWILGETDARQRNAGAGVVVEYASAQGRPRWIDPQQFAWDYSLFGKDQPVEKPATTIPLIFEPGSGGNLWAINGKSYPRTDPFFVQPGVRHRLVFDNRSAMAHPIHLHRHTFELIRIAGKRTAGVFKDVVLVPAKSVVEVDIVANQPGPSLFHCHQQFHMDFGFMALMQYAN
jgi:FtsP/CotA-like multicopper oxidase with cupredoxin domain